MVSVRVWHTQCSPIVGMSLSEKIYYSRDFYYDMPSHFVNNLKKDTDMTENLLQKLEEKMMVLLTEIEDLRKDNLRLNNENAFLKVEREKHTKKLQDLISLLDAVPLVENTSVAA